MRKNTSRQSPPRSPTRVFLESFFAILLGAVSLLALLLSIYAGAWLVIFPALVGGYLAIGLWKGDYASGSTADEFADAPTSDTTFDAEFSYVPGNINYPHVVDQTHQPPPP